MTQKHIQVGLKAPQFACEAVVDGVFEEVALDQYLAKGQWVCLAFIPAAFSFVCPTEVIAFNNCHDEFVDRNCAVLFVSTDSKHSLWHWQNLPRSQGGLGRIRIPLLSDNTHNISRTYGVLQEETGQDLRGSFLIDPSGTVQQITINNIAVGRSVLEMLRLVEAFQAAKENKGLCPANWKPGQDIMTGTYDSRDETLDSLFTVDEEGDAEMQVKSLDTNTLQPMKLTLPTTTERNHRRSPSGNNSISHPPLATGLGPGMLSLIAANSSAHSRNTSTASSKRSSMLAQPPTSAASLGVVTLDFADPTMNVGSFTDGGPATPNEYVSMGFESANGSAKHSRSPSTASAGSSTMMKTLARISGGWTSVASSPKTEMGPNRQGTQQQIKTGYFD